MHEEPPAPPYSASGQDRGLRGVGSSAAAAIGLSAEQSAAIRVPPFLPAWRSRLRVGELAMNSVALASLAMNVVRTARSDNPALAPVRVSSARVAASFGSEKVFRIDDAAPTVWSPLSGFWRTSDGWVRTHGNYPHHEGRLRRLLGLPDSLDSSRVAERASERIATWRSLDLEHAAYESGALAVAVRTADAWRQHPAARDHAAEPLVTQRLGDREAPRPWPSAAGAPLAGIRVLDLTRVIAGPVGTRDLALAGADVLRVDSPRLPEIPWQHLDTGQGKRSTLLDLDVARDRRRFDELLERADILVLGYRPDALARLGLDPGTLASRYPALIIAEISAWGAAGPWQDRRGFDSLVQAASGIALAESADGASPGALPVQALDHSAGHLLAASVGMALARQRATGRSTHVRIALARLAQELLAGGEPSAQDGPSTNGAGEQDPAAATVTQTVRFTDGPHRVTSAAPVLAFEQAPKTYPRPAHTWGSDPPRWR
jgi:crotonobetainyl-CoA:carnitine CoA-transferase CaiB-like acyl-CoA transferase